MRHQDIAELWHSLRSASDITFILREAIGELSTFLIHNEHVPSAHHLRCFVLLKTIFDIQRIHFYTRDRDEKKSLELKSLLDAISCLVKVKSDLDQPSNYNANQESRRLLQQAFVSGLRVLTLRQRFSSQRSSIFDRIAEWARTWNTSSDIDEKVVRPLLEDACQPRFDDWYAAGLGLAEADSRGPAMFFLHNWTSVKDQLSASLRTTNNNTQLLRRFWLWYDAKLALFNASYEFLQASGNNALVNSHDNSTTQTSLLEEVKVCAQNFSSILSESTSRRSMLFAAYLEDLEPTPHCHDCKHSCSCFPPLDDHEASKCGQSRIIKQLNEYLLQRRIAVFNGSNGLDNLSKLLEKRKDDWLVKQASVDSEQVWDMHGADSVNWPQSVLRASYVLNCAGMHCVSGETLLNWMRRTRRSLGSEELYQNAQLFEINIHCESCFSEHHRPTPATFARGVTPLSQLSGDIAALQAEWKDSRPPNDDTMGRDGPSLPSEQTPVPPINPLPERSNGLHTVETPNTSTDTSRTPEMISTSEGSRPPFFPIKIHRPSSKTQSDLDTDKFQSATTAAGEYIYVWHKSKLAIYSTITKKWLGTPSIDGDIHMLCCASTALCVTIKAAGGFDLLIFQLPDCSQLGQAIHINEEVFCMALSHNCMILIVGTSKQIIRVCIPLRTTGLALVEQRKRLSFLADNSEQISVESQAVSFSPRAERAILAIRFKPSGKLTCTIYDMTRQDEFSSKTINLRESLKMTAARDFGLTAVPCIHEPDVQDPSVGTTTFLLCCSVDNADQMLFSFNEKDRKCKLLDIVSSGSDGEPGASIHKAISLPQMPAFLMMNEVGHLWMLQKASHPSNWTCKNHRLSKFPQFSKNQRPRFHLAAMSLDHVYICCFRKGKLTMFTYDMDSLKDNAMDEIELLPFLA